jgi:glutathione peroxidase
MIRSREQRRLVATCTVIAALAASASAFPAAAAQRSAMTTNNAEAGDAYQFEFTSIDGDKLPLAEWRGRPVLVVNTASFCGYTPQYRDLEALYRQYQARGLVVLGVPSNDFGEQEPGSATEIKQFCETNYQVDFPLTEKYRVVGAAAHPFYRWVAAALGEAGAPRWNFHKYLIGPDGQLAGAWPSQVRPTEAAITREIETALPKP